MQPINKPVIGITIGDLNGVGPEIIIKTLADHRLLEMFTPVIFASNKVINFYRKAVPDITFNYQIIKDLSRINHKQINICNCWEEELPINPGILNETGGKYAIASLQAGVAALKENKIHGLVTCPIHKKNTHSTEFPFTGHTPYLKSMFGVKDVLMFMVSGNFRVGLVTEHIPVKEVAQAISKESILSKLNIMRDSLVKDFGIEKPRIAVLGLNPHAGDEGLIGNEESQIIKPAVAEARNNNMLAFGPYSADAFFARQHHLKFDGILAMYHDQGLIPFKSLASGEGVNYTAGLPSVRTSPDHGTAFDIAGKNKADQGSFLAALFACVDIVEQRKMFGENRKNPLKKMTSMVLANAEDEKIEEAES